MFHSADTGVLDLCFIQTHNEKKKILEDVGVFLYCSPC